MNTLKSNQAPNPPQQEFTAVEFGAMKSFIDTLGEVAQADHDPLQLQADVQEVLERGLEHAIVSRDESDNAPALMLFYNSVAMTASKNESQKLRAKSEVVTSTLLSDRQRALLDYMAFEFSSSNFVGMTAERAVDRVAERVNEGLVDYRQADNARDLRMAVLAVGVGATIGHDTEQAEIMRDMLIETVKPTEQ